MTAPAAESRARTAHSANPLPASFSGNSFFSQPSNEVMYALQEW